MLALAAAAALSVSATATASPYIHAHRGGAIVDGRPTYPENTMPAFRHSAHRGFVLELDVKLSADGVPVVIHDATLDRVSDCEGLVAARTFVELRRCRVDILGTDENFKQLGDGDRRRARIPRLATVMRLARRTGVGVGVEIKNQPTDPDFELGDGFADAVANEIAASGIPPSRVIVQSFWPPNLRATRGPLPGAERSLLTLAPLNAAGPAGAVALGAEWVSPAWRVGPAYIAEAHALGLRVVPYTLDVAAEIEGAARAGVDAIISNDPTLARRIVRRAESPRPAIPPPPGRGDCAATHAVTHLRPIVARAPERGAPRVFAMQPKQEARHVVDYAAYRTKIECLIREYVHPRLANGRPNVVAFNEDIGLMTIATGSRGRLARESFAAPGSPSCEPEGVPCGALLALEAVTIGYVGPLAAYRLRFPEIGLIEQSFVAPTDTFARGWMQVFSDMARRYGVYIVGSNTQAPFRESRDPSEIAAFADPDQPRPASVYVATEGNAYNEVFMWGPRDVREEGPLPLRNVVAQNRKLPLTSLEETLEISPGASSGADAIANLRPYRLPGTRARLGFATSLPAFTFGDPPPAGDPCADTSRYYMRCLDRLGTNVVIQDEANPGRWAANGGLGAWQPLEWMTSTYRHVVDPEADFAYNVTPFMTGNLADIVFDGQTAITQRGRTSGPRCTFVGNRRALPEDPERFHRYAGPKRRFLAIAPWVSRSEDRAQLRATSARLGPGSGDPLENDYVETAVIADLPFPVENGRRGCVEPG